MIITFFLVRHGLKEKALGDVPITSSGIKQAEATAQHLSKEPITAIISSPLRRAKETAEYISVRTNTLVKVDDRLRERVNWGDLPDQTFEEFVDMWDRCTRDPDYIPPIGDSARQASDRMSALLSELGKEYPSGSNIVIVTHGGLITDYLVNTYTHHELNRFHPNFIAEQSNLVPECSITKLLHKHDKFSIDCFASVGHLNVDI